MSNPRKGICRYIDTPRGCRRVDCSFSHDRSASNAGRTNSDTPPFRGGSPSTPRRNQSGAPRITSPSTAGGMSSGTLLQRESPSIPRRNESGAPRNTCNFFWTTGQCNRGFECTFRHVQKTNSSSSPQPELNSRDDLDFSTVEGLADINDIVLDPQYRCNPSEAHNEIKQFIADDYTFTSYDAPSAMTKFARILASVDRRNGLWNSDQAQAFLQMIVQGNAIRRISEILQFQSVSSRSGMGFSTLSFQRGYFPVLQFLASDLILKSTLHHNLNALYTALDASFESFCDIVTQCMNEMRDKKTWKDPTPGLPHSRQSQLTGVVVFSTLCTLLQQFFFRFKNVIHNHPRIVPLVTSLRSWFDLWEKAISHPSSTFEDNLGPELRTLTVDQIRESIGRLQEIIRREQAIVASRKKPVIITAGVSQADRNLALLTRLNQSYDPPGHLRKEGPRHSNDADVISAIRIVPTYDELLSPVPPYLPVNLADAPHHCRKDSMERLLDIQFRLLREELVAPIRDSISIIQDDLDTMATRRGNQKKKPTQLEEVLARNGGMYRTSGRNSVMFQVYTNVEFSPLKAERRGFTVGLVIDAPPGGARNAQANARQDYWKHAGSKRLSSGSLVALLLIIENRLQIHLGTVTSSNSELVDSSKFHESSIEIRVNFIDPQVELMALRRDKATVNRSHFAILVDNNIMFESVRPFLDTLQTVEPTSIQFARYLCPSGRLNEVHVLPPKVATAPRFKYNLECLARPEEYIHSLKATDEASVYRARLELKRSSILDASQADAVVDALTREVALIQGPPGTGKSFTGKEILRVLFKSKIRPVVLIAFTNHALDHMLLSLLDAQITSSFVRLGSRTSNERIAEYSLDKLEKTTSHSSTLDRMVGKEYGSMKQLEEQMKEILERIQIPEVTLAGITEYLDSFAPSQLESINQPPYWIAKLSEDVLGGPPDGGGDGWKTVSHKKRRSSDKQIVNTIYGFWKFAQDLEFIRPPILSITAEGVPSKGKKEKTVIVPVVPNASDLIAQYRARMKTFFGEIGFPDQIPPIPDGQRPVADLLNVANVWSMSAEERLTLATFFEDGMRRDAYTSCFDEYELVREEYEEACKRYNDAKDENRRRLLTSVDLIGCTTNGAAKLTSLIMTVSPKVLMVEEAGQVLEAHILASLVPSVQHLIAIGDPQQLRPNIANYSLSMDSERGKELFKFDRSLMERLSDMGLPMSQINVQRRMRPSISAHIRTILYPNLEDHPQVTEYSPVQGMQSDVFFLSHTNRENGGGEEASVSKSNTYEVAMIVDLVMYFLKQDKYSAPGDIAVLCAYLGQLQKVKAALKNLKLAVSLDERDEEQLVRQGIEEEGGTTEQVMVAQHIRLGTVDIFQGEEAKIVIVSLVRNSGSFEGEGASIGFLKSVNRINVALSRAQHGLYVLGNASNLRQNETWRTIIDGMEKEGQIGYGFPIVCPRHPEQRSIITEPGDLSRKSPQGGCLLNCGYGMECGHTCPSVCHSDRDKHRSMKCMMPCLRTPCPRSHPCDKFCSDTCGPCEFNVGEMVLPCGHRASSVLCYEADDIKSVYCSEMVQKKLPGCEHFTIMHCSLPVEAFSCTKTCGGIMACCGGTCKSSCFDCQQMFNSTEATRPVQRLSHKEHHCERRLYCQHFCRKTCSQDHECTTSCKEQCRQKCAHHKCPKPCGDACAPCAEPCLWICPHFSCPVTCGAICARLPCDEPCREKLQCGHSCNSICGEDCSKQKCVSCLSEDEKQDIVDLVMQRSLADIILDSTDISERLITLDCGHLWTVETLDGHCNMSSFYEIDGLGRYLSMKAPPTEFQTPPTCPTCRGPITAHRYGRAIKRANLDILEQNVASSLAKALTDVGPAIQILHSRVPTLETSLKDLKYEVCGKALPDVQAITAKREGKLGSSNEILPYGMLTRTAMTDRHGIPPEEAKVWSELIKMFLAVYRKVSSVVSTRSAHVRAYEAALSTLYRLELAELTLDSSSSSSHPISAFHNVNKKIGQPPHKADCRYQIEGFLISVELRFMLGGLARTRVEQLPLTSNDEEIRNVRRLWASFVDFIYHSCEEDCRKAIAIADKSSSSRLAARSATLLCISEFERFRFDIMQRRAENLALTSNLGDRDWKAELKQEIHNHRDGMHTFLGKTESVYMRSRPIRTQQQLREERAWFRDNCRTRVNRYMDDIDELENHIVNDAVYQAVSMQEKEEIVKAFGFSHRGHFYNCPNGHPFVITECGGAMEASSCPECGEPIGGQNHALNTSNSRAREFEDLARRQGVQESPWEWARDA